MQVVAILVCLLLLVQAQRVLYERLWDHGLKADVSFQKRSMLENESVKVEVTVENDKWLPLPALSVSFSLPRQFAEIQTKQKNLMNTFERNELFTLYSHQRVKRTLTFTCRQRGVYTVDEMMLTNRSLFMDSEETQMLPLGRRIVVYPDCVNMRIFVRTFRNTLGEFLTNDFMNEDVFLIRSIREYQPFDSRRSINWKSTAKLGKLMVNTYEYTNNRKVAVFLNLTQSSLGQAQQILEESIRLAKTWCMSLKKYGIESSLYTNGKEMPDGELLKVEQDTLTQDYLYQVNETLAKIAYVTETDTYADLLAEEIAAHENGYYLIFISADYREGFQRTLCSLRMRGAQLMWVIPKTGTDRCRIEPQISDCAVGWNVYWRKEEQCETGFC